MQVSVETVGTLGRRLKVAVPADQIEKAFANRIRDLAKRVKMPGFRPGKVPLKMIEERYGGSVMQDVAGELINATFRQALGQENLRPAGGPRIQKQVLERGKDLEYTAEFEVYPQVAALDIKGVKIERPVVEITEEDIDRTIKTIQRQRATYNPVTRQAAEGDRVTMDFVGRVNGEEFKGGKADNFSLVIGSGTLVDDFERGLIGAKAGDARDIKVTFPADYAHASLRGQSVDFHVDVKDVAEAVVPAVDDVFAAALGAKDGTVANLRAEVRANLEREAAGRVRGVLTNQVLSALLAANPLELPAGLVNSEIARVKAQLSSTGQPMPDSSGVVEKSARRRVALALILAEIMHARDIKADPQAVRARLEEMAAEYESAQEFIQWHYASPERLAGIESAVMEDQIVTELLQEATVEDKAMGFEQLLERVRTAERQ